MDKHRRHGLSRLGLWSIVHLATLFLASGCVEDGKSASRTTHETGSLPVYLNSSSAHPNLSGYGRVNGSGYGSSPARYVPFPYAAILDCDGPESGLHVLIDPKVDASTGPSCCLVLKPEALASMRELMKGSYEDQELSNLISAAKSSNILWTAIPSNDLKTVKTLAAEHLPDIRLARFDSLSRREGMLLIELETLPSDAAIALKTGRAFLLFSTRNGPSYLLEPYQTTPML